VRRVRLLGSKFGAAMTLVGAMLVGVILAGLGLLRTAREIGALDLVDQVAPIQLPQIRLLV
jgi:hypothetical protein